MVDNVPICPHCGADVLESAMCAMNGCPFGVEETPTHAMDCALHSGPAFDTTHSRCDCGAEPPYVALVSPEEADEKGSP